MIKEYICMECNAKFTRDENIQSKLYKEMGVLADQCEKCLRESM